MGKGKILGRQTTMYSDVPEAGQYKFQTRKQRLKVINDHLKSKGMKPLTKVEMKGFKGK